MRLSSLSSETRRRVGLGGQVRTRSTTFLSAMLLALLILLASSVEPVYSAEHYLGTGIYGTGTAFNASVREKYSHRFCRIAEELEHQTRIDIKCRSYSDQSKFLVDLVSDNISIAYVSSFNYYLVHKQNSDIVPLVVVQEPDFYTDQPSVMYRGAIVTLKDSGIVNLIQLAGRNVGFTYPHSSSGFIYPYVFFGKFLQQSGVKITSQGDNARTADALVNGEVDAIAIWMGSLSKPPLKDRVNVLGTYGGIISYLIVVNQKLLTEPQRKALQESFLGIHEKVKHYEGFDKLPDGLLKGSAQVYDQYCREFPKNCVLN